MSYDPSYRRPPRQERWPNATPQEGWPAYPAGSGQRDGDQAWGATGAFAGARTGRTAADGYATASGYGYGDAWNGHPEAAGGYWRTNPGYAGAGEAYADDSFDGGYGQLADQSAGDGAGPGWDGYGYGATEADYGTAPGNGYGQDGYGTASGNGYGQDGYGTASGNYGQDGYGAGNGYGGAGDEGRGAAVYSGYDEYAGPGPATRAGPALIAPDIIGERDWLSDPDDSPGPDRDRSGLVIGAVMGFLAAATAIGVATLAAAFVRPQASPIIAVGGAFIDRTPPAVKNFAVQHFGEDDKMILLGGMYVTIAFIAMGIGCLARRNVSIGVAGLAAFGLFGAFVAITRPESRAADVIPSVVGGIAGVAALLWLARAAAPVAPLRPSAAASGFRHARGGRRRGAP
jgi:hypothetical protein